MKDEGPSHVLRFAFCVKWQTGVRSALDATRNAQLVPVSVIRHSALGWVDFHASGKLSSEVFGGDAGEAGDNSA
jgi:hypothetical protein